MTERDAFALTTKWVDGIDGLYGYFPFRAANALLATGKFQFHQVCCWGYILKHISGSLPKERIQ